jgi:hypothetical protein
VKICPDEAVQALKWKLKCVKRKDNASECECASQNTTCNGVCMIQSVVCKAHKRTSDMYVAVEVPLRYELTGEHTRS